MDAKAVSRRAFGRLLGMIVVTGVCLFLPAGTFAWWNAWVFMVVGIALVAILTGAVFRKSPDLIEERMTAGGRAKSWDRVFVPVAAVVLPFSSNILAGLDKRFGWTTTLAFPHALAALVVMLAGMMLTFRAMQVNRFFSSHVRIQHDRGHVVIADGPYRIIRHPGYAGTILYNLAAPILLGSLVALWIGVAMAVLFVVRTALEDRTLRRELPGYEDYASRVHFRLIPLLW
jgi:protein-S-isoprenylcysteine O-methyltransferase Ste14